MEKLFLFLFLFLPLVVQANYIKKTDVGLCGGVTVYSSSNKCGADCFKIPKDYNCNYHREKVLLEPDYDNASWTKNQVEECVAVADEPVTTEVDESRTIEENCQDRVEALVCLDEDEGAIYRLDTTPPEAYCSKHVIPMADLGATSVQEDAALKTAHEAAETAVKTYKAGIAEALRLQKCGARAKGLMLVRNAPKGLTNGQKKQLVRDFADAISLLDAGSLDSAKVEIAAATVNAVTTQADKDALIAEIDNCK